MSSLARGPRGRAPQADTLSARLRNTETVRLGRRAVRWTQSTRPYRVLDWLVRTAWAAVVWVATGVRALAELGWRAVCWLLGWAFFLMRPTTYLRMLLAFADRETYIEPLEGFRFLFFGAALLCFAYFTAYALPTVRMSHAILLVFFALLGLHREMPARVSFVQCALGFYMIHTERTEHAFVTSGVFVFSICALICACAASVLDRALALAEKAKEKTN